MFKESNGSIYVTSHAVEVYLPYDYLDKSYRGHDYYSILGNKVQYFMVGNFRSFSSEKEMSNPLSVKVHTLSVPILVTSEPSDIDTREVKFTKSGNVRKCIVLTYMKGDKIISTTASIKSSSNMMIVMTRLESGKFDHMTQAEALETFQITQTMNSINLRVPPEEESIFVAERYRNPVKPSERARFSDNPDGEVISYNMRQEAMKSSTYQAITHEDINTSLISSINRKNNGIVDEPTIMERIVRGMDLTEIRTARDKRQG